MVQTPRDYLGDLASEDRPDFPDQFKDLGK